MTKLLFDTGTCVIQQLESERFLKKGVAVAVLRVDKIHAIVSGNKLFKLHYFLKEAMLSSHKTVLTFGGAYSNHLAATAFACNALGLQSVGIVRGEAAATLSPTLQQCISVGMQLKFVPREQYRTQSAVAFITQLKNELGACSIIPEGGYHPMGAYGAALMMERFDKEDYSHVCTAVGTATTLAGLALGCSDEQQVIGYSVLKGMTDIDERLSYLTNDSEKLQQVTMRNEYHFGGYAKKNKLLLNFMNACWQQHRLPLDFVYTAKMLYGIVEDIDKGFYPPGSSILCIHTGGLQGNNSLPPGTLLY